MAAAPSGGDDTAALQALLDNAGRGDVRLRTGATYKLTGSTGLRLDPAKRGLVGQGSKIDCTGMTGGAALTLTGTSDGFTSPAHANLTGIELAGPGKTSSVTGIKLVGTGAGAASTGVNLSRSAVHDFQIGISEGSYSWCNTATGVAVYNCGTAVDSSGATADAGERFLYVDCNLHNNDLALNAPLPTIGEHIFIGCSMAFNTKLLNLTGPHKAFLTTCHVEYDAQTTENITLSGSNPIFEMHGGVYIQNSNGGLSTALTAGTAVTSITVDKMRVPVTSGDTIVVTDGNGTRDTFTASANVARNATTIPVTSHAPTNSYATGAKVTDPASLPAHVVESSAAATYNRGAHFYGVVMSGVVTSSGDFATGGLSAAQAFVHPPLMDGTCYNPNNGKPLNMPANFPTGTAVSGVLHQQGSTVTISAAGTTSIDAQAAAMQEITVTTASSFALQLNNWPPTGRVQDLTVVIYNNSGGAMGTINWPAAFVFAGKTWTNPATGKRRHLTLRYAPSAGKWLVTAVADADY